MPTAVNWRQAMSVSVSAVWRTASAALDPAAIRSSSHGPSRGSVTFCVHAAPTPARTCAQREATAGLEEAMATPTCPVRAQRAAMEKVTAAPRVRRPSRAGSRPLPSGARPG
ncbi:hypothetical protein GCM10025734_07310 [Kitasatospora paranensis]